MGGIGKTCLTQAYLTQYKNDYAHILWLGLASNDMASSLASVPGLANNLNVNTTGKNTPEIALEILTGLNAIEDKPNLLVIDNAEEELEGWRDRLLGDGQWHILVTSRKELFGFQTKQLGFLGKDAAKSLFQNHYKRSELNDSAIEELVSLVDYHTLTIEILAKTAQVKRMSLTRLKTALKKDWDAGGVKVLHQSAQVDKFSSYIQELFQIGQEELSAHELWLLKQFVCLPSEFHSFDLLKSLLGSDDEDITEALSSALNSLVVQGWLLVDNSEEQYKMHAIVGESVYSQLNIILGDVSVLLDDVTQRIFIDQTKDNPIDKFQWVPFGNRLLNRLVGITDEKVSHLENNLALVLKALGDYEGAKGLLEKALASAEENFGEAHPSTAVRYSNLALVLKDLGDYEGAKGLLEKALASAEENFGEAHPTTAVSYLNLGVVLNNLCDYEHAYQLLKKAHAVFSSSLPKTHRFVTSSANFCEKIEKNLKSTSAL